MANPLATILIIGCGILFRLRKNSYTCGVKMRKMVGVRTSGVKPSDSNASAFSFRLYQEIGKEKFENMFFSPYSISAALSMVLLGAEGGTAAELSTGLGFGDKRSNAIHKDQLEVLKQLAETAGNITLETANKLFIEQCYGLTEKFLQDALQYYQSEAESLNFSGDSDNSRIQINKWVESKTNNKIQDLLPTGSIDSRTRLVIANAIYFKGDWMNKFNERHTTLSNFYVNEKRTDKVQMMSQKKKFRMTFDRDLGVQVVNLPYQGRKVSMVLIVPTERFGLQKLESRLSHEKLQALTAELYEEDVELVLPRMKLEYDMNLIPVLQKLGIREVFDQDKANLQGISGQPDLFVSGAFHKAFLEVNEEGSEAAAATAVVMVRRSALSMPVRVVCDHPFMFLIKHNPTRSILFMGRFVVP